MPVKIIFFDPNDGSVTVSRLQDIEPLEDVPIQFVEGGLGQWLSGTHLNNETMSSGIITPTNGLKLELAKIWK